MQTPSSGGLADVECRLEPKATAARAARVALSGVAISICDACVVAQAPNRRTTPVLADVVLRGGTLIDGTGAPGRRADLAIRGERIVAAGTFEIGPRHQGDRRHPRWLSRRVSSTCTPTPTPAITEPAKRLNRNYLTQGVTTVVTGNCGLGALDAAKFLATIDAHGAGTNVIHLIPLGAVRSSIMGNADRPPSADELTRMKQLVERGMEAGAWGLSSGLIYVPGRYARTPELIELAKVAARHGGIYASHIRNEGARLADRSTRRSRSARGPESRCTSRT